MVVNKKGFTGLGDSVLSTGVFWGGDFRIATPDRWARIRLPNMSIGAMVLGIGWYWATGHIHRMRMMP